MSEPAIILFDGFCNLCNASVRLILDNDPAAHFRFAPLQSEAGRAALSHAGGVSDACKSVVLVENGRAYTRSDAGLRIATSMRFPWPLLAAFFVLPRRWRDGLYDFIARNRYRWFGTRETCAIPTPDQRKRFL